MAQLQRPAYAFMNGTLVPWNAATLHIGCEGVTRGLNVFEGLKGYWQPDGQFKMLMLERHFDRLKRSARLLHIPCRYNFEEYQAAVDRLIGALAIPNRDMWARTTLFAVEGHWGEGTVADLVVTAYHQDKQEPPTISIGVSTWQRSGDLSLPARIKAGSNYQVARLARMEGTQRGCQEMVLLNQWGRVAETTGACILIVRNGTIYTPPSTEGALESITLDIVESLALSIGILFVRRPIDRTELLVADEIAVCGTLAELTLVRSVENLSLDAGSPIVSALQRRYFDAVRGVDPHPSVELTALPSVKRAT